MNQIIVKLFPPDPGIINLAMDRLIETIHMAIIASTFATILLFQLVYSAALEFGNQFYLYTRLLALF